MAKQTDLRDGDIVTNPDWNNGRPVRITRVGDAIRWQDIGGHGPARQVAYDDDAEVTVTARRGGR